MSLTLACSILKASLDLISLAICHDEDAWCQIPINSFLLEVKAEWALEAVSSTHWFHLSAFGESTKLLTLRRAIKMRLYSDHQVLCDRRDANLKH